MKYEMKDKFKIILLVIFLTGCKTYENRQEDRNVDELYLNTTPGKEMILDVDMCTDCLLYTSRCV